MRPFQAALLPTHGYTLVINSTLRTAKESKCAARVYRRLDISLEYTCTYIIWLPVPGSNGVL